MRFWKERIPEFTPPTARCDCRGYIKRAREERIEFEAQLDLIFNATCTKDTPGNLPIIIWQWILQYCNNIIDLKAIAQVCTFFNLQLQGAAKVVFPAYRNNYIIQFKMPPNKSLGLQDITFIADVKPSQSKHGIIFTNSQCEVKADTFRLEMNDYRYVAVVGFGVNHCRAPNVGEQPFKTWPVISSTPIPLDVATNVAMVRKGREISLFINGKKDAVYKTEKMYEMRNQHSFRVGAQLQATQYSVPVVGCCNFPGEITSARLWFCAVDEDKIAALAK